MRTATRAPFLTFVRTGEVPQLRIAEKNLSEGWQKFKNLTAVVPGHDGLLSTYQAYIDVALEERQQEYRQYVREGGTASFFAQCWMPLLSAAVEEATLLLNKHPYSVEDKEKLLQDLKRISEGCLLVLDKALA